MSSWNTAQQAADEEQELVRECVLFGLLFRAAMVDLAALARVPLKLSYQQLLEELSRWAERRHHQLRRALGQRGCRLLTSRKQDGVYVVQYRVRGYLREAVYSGEVLRAECQERVRLWITSQGSESTKERSR
jgi:hypothetical protein